MFSTQTVTTKQVIAWTMDSRLMKCSMMWSESAAVGLQQERFSPQLSQPLKLLGSNYKVIKSGPGRKMNFLTLTTRQQTKAKFLITTSAGVSSMTVEVECRTFSMPILIWSRTRFMIIAWRLLQTQQVGRTSKLAPWVRGSRDGKWFCHPNLRRLPPRSNKPQHSSTSFTNDF